MLVVPYPFFGLYPDSYNKRKMLLYRLVDTHLEFIMLQIIYFSNLINIGYLFGGCKNA
jgi:hypothetical protein